MTDPGTGNIRKTPRAFDTILWGGLDGAASGDLDEYCARYEASIQRAGGIDLQILGIGRNGHIGFNEPSSSLASRTRIKTLTRQTLEDNRRLFQEGQPMPEAAITMGIGTIVDARKVLLLASGTSKARALARAIRRTGHGVCYRVRPPVTPRCDYSCRRAGSRRAQRKGILSARFRSGFSVEARDEVTTGAYARSCWC